MYILIGAHVYRVYIPVGYILVLRGLYTSRMVNPHAAKARLEVSQKWNLKSPETQKAKRSGRIETNL